MGVVDNLIHLFAPLTANCRDFNGLWASARPVPGSVAGPWEGEWISSATGHRGRLRCVVQPGSATAWTMWFRGEYAGVFRACYRTEFRAAQEGERWTFSGGSNLGPNSRALADLIGLDTCVAIMDVLYEGLGNPKYAPCPLLRQYVQAGRLGRKSGRGFYEY